MVDRSSARLHRFATFTAAATYVLLFLGGLVTSTGSGLAVPDWPLSFGQVFPAMVGGVLYEHGHRLAASAVGLFTLVLTTWVVLTESRPAVRGLGVAMLVAVLLQGILGGVTVLYKLPIAVSVTHACLAQVFFCLAVTMAMVTGPGWGPPRSPALSLATAPAGLAALTTSIVFLQLLLGAITRHMGAGLAIPDFPLAFGRLVPPFETPLVAVHYAHRCGALTVALFAAILVRTIVHHHPALRRLATLLAGLVITQIAFGALIIWTRRAVIPTTTHLVVGAATLATCVAITLRAARQPVASPAVTVVGRAALA